MKRPKIMYTKSWRLEPKTHFIAMVRKEDYDELKQECNRLIREAKKGKTKTKK